MAIRPDWSKVRGADPAAERTTLSILLHVLDVSVLPESCGRCGKASIVATQIGIAGTDHVLGTVRRCTYCASEPPEADEVPTSDHQEDDAVFGHDEHRHTGDPEQHVPDWARDLYDRVSFLERRTEKIMAESTSLQNAMTDLDGLLADMEQQLVQLRATSTDADQDGIAAQLEQKIAAARAAVSQAPTTVGTPDPGVADTSASGAIDPTAPHPGTDGTVPAPDGSTAPPADSTAGFSSSPDTPTVDLSGGSQQ